MEHSTDIHIAAWEGNIQAARKILQADHSMARLVDETLYGGEQQPLELQLSTVNMLPNPQKSTHRFTMLHIMDTSRSLKHCCRMLQM